MKKIFKKVASRYVSSIAKSLSLHDQNDVAGTVAKHSKLKINPRFEKEGSMMVGRLPGYFLIASIIGVFYLFYLVVAPFFPTLLLASVLTILFYGMYKKIHAKFGKFKKLASFVSCLIVFLIIVIPVTLFIILLAQEAAGAYQTISTKFASGAFDKFFVWDESNWFFTMQQRFIPFFDVEELNIKGKILNAAESISVDLAAQAAILVKNIGSVLFHAVIMIFSMFYLFLDGEKFIQKFTILSPLPRKYEKQIFGRIDDTVKAIASGVFLVAIIQGLLAGIGYTIAGISNPVFWGAATAFFSLIPLVGTAAIWVPAAIILFIFGDYASAIFLGIWGVLLVATIDNFIAPYLIGGRAKTYPLLTFFVVIGGLWTFGAQGLIFGPIILVLLLTLLHVYELEYKTVLDK